MDCGDFNALRRLQCIAAAPWVAALWAAATPRAAATTWAADCDCGDSMGCGDCMGRPNGLAWGLWRCNGPRPERCSKPPREVYSARVLAELLPWAEKRFGLSKDPKRRALAGSSFGGVATLYMAMLHPEAFDAVIVESPSFWACEGRIMQDISHGCV